MINGVHPLYGMHLVLHKKTLSLYGR